MHLAWYMRSSAFEMPSHSTVKIPMWALDLNSWYLTQIRYV